MDLPVITTVTPITIPAVEQKVFDKYWITSLTMDANDPSKPIVVIVNLKKCCTLASGAMEFLEGSETLIKIDNLLAQAQSDSDLATLTGAIMMYIAKMTATQNV